ncbi:hypothetical protein [Lumpfish ranavirus]|uniref:Uncharacterized protein n=1 Tax=Lumpfish ranavirus TaxID=2501771 RepID=A0A3Q9T7H8_9VIRU|nr:hypothetical protein QKE36_gp75 [Lumpfish ranavirus]AZY88473.1 hypothetical protein [Lumpfish ranavirus]AZY88669.1 hypothetical protein [Lumpfish ranavirus]
MIRVLCTIVLVVAVALYMSLVYGYYESFGVPDDSWFNTLIGDWPDAEVPFFDKIVGEAPEDETVYTERPYQVSTSQSPTTTTTLKPTTKAVLASIGATPTPVVCHDISGDIPGVRCDDLVAMGFTVLRMEGLPQGGYHTVVVKKPGVNCKRIPYITSVKTNPRRRVRIGALHAIGKCSVSGASSTSTPDANQDVEPMEIGAWHPLRKRRSSFGVWNIPKKLTAEAPDSEKMDV